MKGDRYEFIPPPPHVPLQRVTKTVPAFVFVTFCLAAGVALAVFVWLAVVIAPGVWR